MQLYDLKKDLPFEKKTDDIFDKQTPVSVNRINARNTGMSLRATIMMVLTMLSFSMIYVQFGFKPIFLVYLLTVVVWRFTFGLFEKPHLIVLNLFLNSLLFLPISCFGGYFGLYPVVFPLAIGVTVLSYFNGDGRALYYVPDALGEVILPSIIGFGTSTFAYLISKALFDSNLISVLMIISILLYVFISVVYSKVFSSDYLLSSQGVLNEDTNFLRQGIVFSVLALMCFVLTKVYVRYSPMIPVKLPAVLNWIIPILVLVVYFAIFIDSQSYYGLVQCSMVVFMSYPEATIKSIIIFVISNFMILILLKAYSKHKIFTTKNKYITGMPTILITIFIMLLIFESIMK